MIEVSDIAVYVVNLSRRPDRRERMLEVIPSALHPTFTSDWSGPFDGHTITVDDLKRDGVELFPWEIESDNPWWSRPLKLGEIGCTLSHIECWRHAVNSGKTQKNAIDATRAAIAAKPQANGAGISGGMRARRTGIFRSVTDC